MGNAACLKDDKCKVVEVSKDRPQAFLATMVPSCGLFKSKKGCVKKPGTTFAKKKSKAYAEACDTSAIQYGVRLMGKKSYKKENVANPCICEGICSSRNAAYFTYSDKINECACIPKSSLSATKTNRQYVSSIVN